MVRTLGKGSVSNFRQTLVQITPPYFLLLEIVWHSICTNCNFSNSIEMSLESGKRALETDASLHVCKNIVRNKKLTLT